MYTLSTREKINVLLLLQTATKSEIFTFLGFKVLEVVSGRADAYIHLTDIKKWDICAGNAILNEMGGRMSTKLNDLIDYSDSEKVVNEDGLVATVRNHDLFVNKF